MTNEELARLWKDPEAREGTTIDHPSGLIGSGRATLRRMTGLAGLLLAAAAVVAAEDTITETSITCVHTLGNF
ncbi:hypothetical protein Lfu02_60060 [Longispora fulva]|uniref:Uncharacterized protein n=1 Tax=Longispora fulva TaxID=619741 RepID=A0A8J7KWW2_9ACTN|nr:hypothetical protein [Longispora fulva]MBG6137012.1 hypothetical protein [Longispora fulva]GIG61634.1 hypothetical protein Lfu02_60060 [Longispora fulva]